MTNKLALGLMLAMSIASTAWSPQPAVATLVTGRSSSSNPAAKSFKVESPTGRITFKTDDRTVFLRLDTRVSLPDLRVGDHVRVAYGGDEPNRIAVHVETIDTPSTGGHSVTGRVTFLDVAGRRVTLDLADGSTEFGSVNRGDPVRVQPATDSPMANRVDILSGAAQNERTLSTNRSQWSKTLTPRRLMGLWLLAMTGTAVVLRSRLPRTFRGSRT